MDEVDDLVIIPFREIVEKGRRALQNADSHPTMLKAAEALVKEGERGLKRIEPLCRKHLDDYGAIFIASLKDSDEIANYRAELTDLLWEFDDYTELDEFEETKFTELKALSRKAAPRIVDILMRMKMDSPFGPNFGANFKDDTSSRGSIAQLHTPTSPPALLASSPNQRGSASSSSDFRSVDDATNQLGKLMMHVDIPERPPRSPLGNPWDWHVKLDGDNRSPEEIEEDRKAADQESPVLPLAPLSPVPNLSVVHPPPIAIPGSTDNNCEDPRYSTSAGSYPNYSNSYQRPRAPTWTSQAISIPEDSVYEQPTSPFPTFQQTTGPYSPTHRPHPSVAASMDSEHSVFGETLRHDLIRMQSRDSNLSAAGFSPVQPPIIPQQPGAGVPRGQPGLETVPIEMFAPVESGLITVESEFGPGGRKNITEQKGTPKDSIIDEKSSFRMAKGFCNGAEEVIMGKAGVRRTKKPVGFASTATVARCTSCLYELDFKEIEADVNNEERGNFTRCGIDFRIRFLQKSHIQTRRVDDVQYGCVFCVYEGHTINKSDATIFFNQKALFDHIARHPRPLPKVPGLCVIEEIDMPESNKNDYDIHLRSPIQRHPCIERAPEIDEMPSGVAKDQARRMYSQRLLYDRSPALELAQGAKITGITWPIQYQGEWCFGWHDGNWASVPTDLVKLNPPPDDQIPKYDKTSLVRAKARWKFAVKDKENKDKVEWLKFDKNEIISNISWVDMESWCWSGTNSKGKSGLFPQAYIDTNHLEEPSTSTPARAESLSEEKARSQSIFSKVARRKNSAGNKQRPPSIAASSSSHETAITKTSSSSMKQRQVPIQEVGLYGNGLI